MHLYNFFFGGGELTIYFIYIYLYSLFDLMTLTWKESTEREKNRLFSCCSFNYVFIWIDLYKNNTTEFQIYFVNVNV